MEIDIISLLPSKALQARLREENHVFSEKDTLLLLYRYARTQQERLTLLTEFADAATEAYATLSRRIAAWEEEKLERFRALTPGFLYELSIRDLDAECEDRCLCDTYETAIASIKAYNTAYADVLHPEDPRAFLLYKHPVMTGGDPWVTENPASCRVDAEGRVLFVEDESSPPTCSPDKKCVQCEELCLYDDVTFPFFAAAGQLIRYTNDHYPHAKAEYGLCTDDFDRNACSCIYVYPLRSDTVRLCDVGDEARLIAHEHIPAPLCDIISPENLPEDLRDAAIAFWAAYRAR